MKELKITNKNIDDIKEYENNAKEHPEWQIEQIANSIQEFGFNDPIAVNADDQIIEGHGRLLAAKKLGLSEVPCIVLTGLTEVQERAYIIAHNKTTMNTDFDLDRLQYELNALKVEGFDLSLTGFSEYEIDKLNYSALDEIKENDYSSFSNEVSKNSKTFSVTFLFDKENEEEVMDFIRENGKDEIVKIILKEIGG
ncbi:ParB/Srx family N-terminal domain-containing protein [Fusobacterium pseudoperiodonticum]|uniref:ParB/Srx family N-terminal domain-containing protein n=1 Tax=Fusobacterium pseudoperiodonticum TaxID=2663009 RepID=UPI0028D55CAE|nr:ParB/Srx family N-terminal domain-containing protein [Fusobacterium pseudoperiodonticum]